MRIICHYESSLDRSSLNASNFFPKVMAANLEVESCSIFQLAKPHFIVKIGSYVQIQESIHNSIQFFTAFDLLAIIAHPQMI